ncbi:MAG: RnfABCDGE type electron transport complex subunit D [candidate division WOR-3 bacterium]|nr:RnfABCDGE type electron transport complex subunit D [candidate division WOR-3 bacterium]MCX7756754.1 RnfABCDGE type electron transport complex subunit D [candidate division WOR-3 bacterium]MDW7987368.1 RnfABCDGE type electron transport complex subunit D [candidate division WOR-3 bacterium]
MNDTANEKFVIKELYVSHAPHLHAPISISKIMWNVVIALIPALLGAIYYFGLRALILTLIAVVSAIGFEAFTQKLFSRKITILDGSAVITGILIAYNLPPGVPWWIPIVGSAFAIIIVKQLFGGLGYNFINPALAARAFLVASWPQIMTTKWLAPRSGYLAGFDAITQATPLSLAKHSQDLNTIKILNSWPVIKNLFLGNCGGCIGETSALLLLIGGIYLLARGYINYRIPLAYILTVLILSILLPTKFSPLFHLFSGGLMLGAFFMATDYVTSPVTPKGQWIFGVGCGILTMLIRLWGGYPEGVSYSILLMNVATPLIERYTKPKVFGYKRTKKQ